MNVVCVYFGRSDECQECGFFNRTGTPFCSHECAAGHAERVAAMDAARQARRAREDAFAAAVESLQLQGYTDAEIDIALAGMPS